MEENSLLQVLKSKQTPQEERNANLLAAGATPLLAGLLLGNVGDAAEIGAKSLDTEMERQRKEDSTLMDYLRKRGVAAKPEKPSTMAQFAKIKGQEGQPVLKKLDDYEGEELYEKPEKGFQLAEKKELAKFKSGLEKKSKKGEFKNVADLRKERSGLKITKTTTDVASAFDRVLAGSTGGNAASDVGMVFAYMKMLDPGSVVRESEQITARKARGVEEALSNIEAWFKEGRNLTDTQIVRFVNEAKKIYGRQMKAQSKVDEFFRKQAKKVGIDPEDVIVPIGASPESDLVVGAVEGGYRYKGGNPSLESSWEKVK